MISNRYKSDGREVFTLFRKGIVVKRIINQKISSGEWKLMIRKCECGNNDSEILSEKNKYGISQRIQICRKCGLIFYSPALDHTATVDFYVNYYNDLCAASITPAELFQYQYQRGLKILNFLEQQKQVIDLRGISTILEIGTGTGGILKAVIDKHSHLQAFGTEYRDEEIAIARGNGIVTFKGDSESFIKQNGVKIDLIILNHVMEHFIDIGDELQKIKQIMHDNSVLLVGVPGVMHTHKDYDSFLESISLDHNYFFTSRTLNYVMNKNGFKNLYIDEDVNALYKLSDIREYEVPPDEYRHVTRYLSALEKNANRPLKKLRSLRIEYKQLMKNIILNFFDNNRKP